MSRRKRSFRFFDRRGLSPIFATMLLAAIVIVFGSTAYYFSTNLTKSATDNYVQTSSNSQQAVSERIGFEYVQYSSSSSTLTIYLNNCGIANNIQIGSVFIYYANNTIVGAPYQGSQILALQPIPGSSPSPSPIIGNSLNVGQEAFFKITGVSLNSGSPYAIHLVTKSGSTFEYDFTA